MSEWISVKDRMPEPFQDVLVHEKYNDIPFVGFFKNGKWKVNTLNYDTDGDASVTGSIVSDDVTHWMPFPPNPLP